MPFFPFYVRDWLSSSNVAAMTLAERGAYIDLLARMWEHSEGREECSLPADDAYLARLLGASPREWRALRAVLIDGMNPVFSVHCNRLSNARLSAEWTKAKQTIASRSKAGKASAAARASNTEATRVEHVSDTCAASHIPHAHAHAEGEGKESSPAPAAAAPGEAPVPTGKRSRAPDPRIRPVIDRFAALHLAQVGTPYAVVGGRDGERIRSLPKGLDLDKLLGYVEAFFQRARADPFLRGKGLTIPLFVGYIPTLQRLEAETNGVAGGHPGARPVARPAEFTASLYQRG